MGEEHGEVKQVVVHQAVGRQLHPDAGELDHVRHAGAAGGRGGGARPHPRAAPPAAHLQTVGSRIHEARRQRDRVLARLPVLHHHQPAQPALPARDLSQGEEGGAVGGRGWGEGGGGGVGGRCGAGGQGLSLRWRASGAGSQSGSRVLGLNVGVGCWVSGGREGGTVCG